MVTSSNLVFSLSAAFRILQSQLVSFGKLVVIEKLSFVKGKFHAIYKIRFGNKIYRWSCYISRRTFNLHFVQRRQEEGQKMVVREWEKEGVFSVFNSAKGTLYHVFATPEGLECECEDYQNQIRFLGKGCCKHNYAVLNYLGFKNLKDYLDSGGLRL